MDIKSSRGFTLIELLVVIAIISILIALTSPMLLGLLGSNSVNRAAGDLSDTLAQARTYAMANNTYVRVGFGTVPASSSRPTPGLVVLALASSDGTLDNSITAATGWSAISAPLVLNNLDFNYNNNGLWSSIDMSNDATPGSDTNKSPLAFSRTVGTLGSVNFNGCIQFNPSGAAEVTVSTPARFIEVSIDRPTQSGKNPFVIRLEGLTGAMEILRN